MQTKLHTEKTVSEAAAADSQKFLSASVGMKPKEKSRGRGSCTWCPSWCPFCAREDEAGGKRLATAVDTQKEQSR